MKVRYVSTYFNTNINLNDGKNIRMAASDLLDYSWDMEKTTGAIKRFTTGVQKKDLVIDITAASGGPTARQILSDLVAFFDRDISNGIPGRLFIDDCYIECFVSKGKIKKWESESRMSCTFQLTAVTCWLQEDVYKYKKKTEITAVSSALDYPYDYSYDYVPDVIRSDTIIADLYTNSDFKLKIYGPVRDPAVVINNIERKMYGSLEEGEYFLINSLDKTIIKSLTDGTIVNAFNNRKKDVKNSIFNKLAHGENDVHSSGEFGFDLTVITARSVPSWG